MRPKVQWIYSWHIFCVVNHNLCRIECGRVLDPFTIFPFQISKKVFADSLWEIIKNEGVHPLHSVGRAVLADGVSLDFLLLYCRQVCTDVFLKIFGSKVFKLSFFILVINHDLWLDYVKWHIENDDTACYAPISNSISIHELLIVGLKGGVSGYFHMIFEDEVDGAAEMMNLYLVLVGEAEIPRYICVDSLDIHVCGCGEGGRFIPHEPFWEGAQLVEGQPIYGSYRVITVISLG